MILINQHYQNFTVTHQIFYHFFTLLDALRKFGNVEFYNILMIIVESNQYFYNEYRHTCNAFNHRLRFFDCKRIQTIQKTVRR